ncbi:MAG TPA: c-type cytochrome [Gaiellaceae bacterium]|jgi:ubiquinol-cytochrome c reductase cytochrome c subunit
MRRRLVTVAVLAGALVLPLGASAATPAQVERGNHLYGRYCLSCHGAKGSGTPNTAPSLRGAGALAADFYLRTGYMPLHEVGTQPRRTRLLFDEGELQALTAYVASLGQGPPIPKPRPSRGNLAEGMHAFTDHCAGCHQIVAEGGYVTGALPPALENATDVQIAEAVRIGPYVMPTFSKQQISDRTLDSIIAYVDYVKHPDDRGGWALGHLGPVPEGLVTWLIAAALAVVFCVVIGKRLRRT